MASPLPFFFFLCFFLLAVWAPRGADGSFACLPVIAALAPCLGSLTGEPPGEPCCEGVAAVAEQAKMPFGKVIVCHCLKDLMKFIPLVTPDLVRSVARHCNVDFAPPSSHTACFDMSWLQLHSSP